MPIYEYECLDCGALSEFIEGVSAVEAKRVCRQCGGEVLRRVLPQGVTARTEGGIGRRGGATCCGRQERCGNPPCDDVGGCCR